MDVICNASYSEELVPAVLNDSGGVHVQMFLPGWLDQRLSVLDCEYKLHMQLRKYICHKLMGLVRFLMNWDYLQAVYVIVFGFPKR